MSAAPERSHSEKSAGARTVAGSTSPRPPGSAEVTALVVGPEGARSTQECVAQEVGVAFELDGTPHVVMLATPADLEDFALGFCLTEGLVDDPSELLACEIRLREKGVVLALGLAPAASARREAEAPRRNLTGRTGCGLCGTDDLERVVRLPRHALPSTRVRAGALARGLRELAAHQRLAQATGGTHAAAFCDLEGRVRVVREDVGRHNALDKLIGAIVRAGIDAAAGFAAVTSRASVEMVQKAAIAGIPILAAVSAPTQLAIQCARESNLLLAGFVRDGRATIYAGAPRLEPEEQA